MPLDIDEKGSAVVSGKGPIAEPLLGRLEQDPMLILEQQLVPRARDANEHLLHERSRWIGPEVRE